ncbi:MAG: PEP-CTERM sorting domain-containing protein [Planctomycetes bacterium]|nr:PEP-CTERM sorting domain-containing protein [Planctomycetota bacterium]
MALSVAGQARAIDIDFDGYTTGDIAGQTGSTASGGVDAAAGASWETWQFGPGENVVDDNLGTAGSETSANPIAVVNTPDLWNSNWARLEVDGVSDDAWTLSGIVQYDGEFSTAAPGRMVWFGLQLYRGDTEVFGLGKGGGDANYTMFGDASADSGVPVVSGEAVHLKAEYDGSSVKMYVDGVLEATDNAPGDLSGLDHLYIRTGSGALSDTGVPPTGTFSADNISLVVPEPASLALLGLGGVVMLGRRRRQA